MHDKKLAARPRIIFDTSAINALADDPERETIIKRVKETSDVLVTAINVVEVVATFDGSRRQQLLSLMRDLTGGTNPLAMPNKLLRRSMKAYAKKKPSLTITITQEDAPFWHVLQTPEDVGEDERQEAAEWIASLEQPFRGANREARPDFQAIFDADPVARPTSVGGLFRYFRENDSVVYDFVRKVYKQATGRVLAPQRLWPMFEQVPEWPLYLAAWGHEMFWRSIKAEGYGLQGRPNNLDLWAATYLRYCDVFVTNDTGGKKGKGRGGQYRALRLLNTLVPQTPIKPARAVVSTYVHFRAETIENIRIGN